MIKLSLLQRTLSSELLFASEQANVSSGGDTTTDDNGNKIQNVSKDTHPVGNAARLAIAEKQAVLLIAGKSWILVLSKVA